MLLFRHRDEDAKLLQSHGMLLHQFHQGRAEARGRRQERCAPERPYARLEGSEPEPNLSIQSIISTQIMNWIAGQRVPTLGHAPISRRFDVRGAIASDPLGELCDVYEEREPVRRGRAACRT